MNIRCKARVRNISVSIGLNRVRPVRVNQRRLDQRDCYGLARIEAASRDIDERARRVIALVGLHRSIAVSFGGGEHVSVGISAAAIA